MEPCVIQFHAIEKDFLPPPYPASKAIPEWFKNMPADIQNPQAEQFATVKQCPPFLDAMSSGYIIPLSGDVHFTMDSNGNLTCETPDFQAGIAGHPSAQVTGTPWASLPIVKFLNPWLVITPPGYSTLFLSPLNRVPIPFTIFAGVVETDNLYREVNFPAACTMARGSRYSLQRGTPLVQAIPFKREDWQSQIHQADAKRLSEIQRQISSTPNVYRDWFYEKKTYG